MKVKNLLICIFIMSFIMCPITVFAAETYDMIITDMTEEEIEEVLENISFFGTTSTINIARWTKVIDNTKADVNEYSVVYYCPTYESIVYNNYSTYKYNNQFVTVYYPDGTTWNGTDYRYLKSGSCIEIRTTSLDETKDILFNDEIDRIEISAKYHITETVYGILGGSYSITYQFNSTNHADTYYIWYNSTFNTNPPLFNNDGTCAVHDYNTITIEATCTQPGGLKHICKHCNYSYLEETIATLEHDFVNNVCVNCGAEYKPPTDTPDTPDSGGSGNNNIDYGDLSFLGKVNAVVQSKLNDNAMYNSLLYIVNTLSSLFTEDYTSAEGFYNLGIFSLNIRKPTLEYGPNFGNDIVGDFEQNYTMQTGTIDWGLDNVQVMNLDWFFGKTVEYTGDGTPYKTKGVKATSDAVISGFMWLIFGWNVYIKLPDLIAGEGGQIVSATSSANGYFNKREQKQKSQQTNNKKKEGNNK